MLVPQGSHAHYVQTGHLVYRVGETLQAVPFDAARLEVTGAPAVVLDEIGYSAFRGAEMAISANGTFVYSPATLTREGTKSIVWVDRDGTTEHVKTIEAADYRNLRLSPDGRSVLVFFENDLWIHDISSGRRTRVTRDGSVTGPLVWSSKSSRVAYTSTRGGTSSFNVWVQPVDGSGEPFQVTKLEGIIDVDSWSPDERTLAVHQHVPDGSTRMLMIDIDREGLAPEPFVDNEPDAEGGTFSPDGRYVAYTSSDTGQREVYIRPYPRSGGRTTV